MHNQKLKQTRNRGSWQQCEKVSQMSRRASTMAGEKTGVATQIRALNSKCLYTHWYGHALNLAVADAIGKVHKWLSWDCKRDREACEKVAPEKHEVG